MQTHISQNDDKTRRAVVNGKHVQFYRRPVSKERYQAPLPIWHDYYPNHIDAKEAADLFAACGKLKLPNRKPRIH